MNKKTIAFDFDEVLFPFVKPLIVFHNRIFKTDLKFEDFYVYNFRRIFGGNKISEMKKMEMFYKSNEFLNITPIPGALKVLTSLKEYYNLVVVTSRSEDLYQQTMNSINKYFPNIFNAVKFGNHHTNNLLYKYRTKLELCKEVNAFILVDDNINYCKEVAKSGIHCILFGNYPWNEYKERFWSSSIESVKGWDEVEMKVVYFNVFC